MRIVREWLSVKYRLHKIFDATESKGHLREWPLLAFDRLAELPPKIRYQPKVGKIGPWTGAAT